MTAKLIVFEGGDGAGKGTQAKALVERALSSGQRAGALAFPDYSNNVGGHICGQILQGAFGPAKDLHPDLKMVVFAADRFESMPRLTQLMAENDLVVIDRYMGSNAVYQGALMNDQDFETFARKVFGYELKVLPEPDLTILLDTDPIQSMAKAQARAELDENERNKPLQLAAAERYRWLADQDFAGAWHRVDAMDGAGQYRTIEDIGADVWTAVFRLNS